jgi:hypothetical protein
MAEANKERRNRLYSVRRGQREAASLIRDNRDTLSQSRRDVYEGGTFQPEPPPRYGLAPLTAAAVAEVRRLVEDGHALDQVARDLNLHPVSVARVCKVLRVTPKEKDHDQADADTARRAPELGDHDAGVCDRDCRLGRHAYRGRASRVA